MTASPSSKGTAQSITFWILSCMFAVIMAFWAYQNTFKDNASAKNDVRLESTVKLTTEHEVKIKSIEKDITEIKDDVKETNTMLREFFITRYGYVPKDNTLN